MKTSLSKTVAAVVCVLRALSAMAAESPAFANKDCLECHSELADSRTVNGKTLPLELFKTNRFEKSIHAGLNCLDCHRGVTSLEHDGKLPEPTCMGCHPSSQGHEKAAKDYSTGIHGLSHMMGASGAASCWDCHGSHDIVPVKNLESPVFKFNQPKTCAACHSNPGLTEEYQMRSPEVASNYMDSIHGQKLLKQGLIVAPSCADCHGAHDIKRAVDRDAPINKANVAKTCGKCHFGVEETYMKSVHGQLLATGDMNGPVCTDCHSAHRVEVPASGHFKVSSDERCGRCHEDMLARYRETYHGKAMALGKAQDAADVAACYDCHGHHDVLPHTNPDSHLSKKNIVATCQKCHPNANPSFAAYDPHANPHDRKANPVLHAVFVMMTALLVGVFVLFGLHTLAWLIRAVYLYMHDSKTFRESKIATQTGGEWFTRFAPFDRFLHFLVVTSFLLLVITGMPLKFYYTEWARAMFSVIGGPETSRALHRFGAVVTFLYFGLHLCAVIGRTWRGRKKIRDPQSGKITFKQVMAVVFGPDSMIPTLQDWRDFVAHNKWFFGKGPRPHFDRWTYWEKFDYFAVFWGVFIIGSSGLVMWFPEFFTKFLPGWTINVALIIHSDEALLAAGFIFSIHFFNTHFRIEKFPMDTVIFSGRVSKNEMLHERRRWYDRLVAEGRLDDFRVRDEWLRWKNIARSFGYIFFGIGVVLLFLIIYAMVTWMGH
jgi:cytochrome b subunit of formate dehydrogenase